MKQPDPNDWISASDEPPDFLEYGFHTGRKVEVRRADGSEQITIYQGFGLFGEGGMEALFEDVTHWRPVDCLIFDSED